MVAFGYCTWAGKRPLRCNVNRPAYLRITAFAALRAFALSRDWLLSTAIFVLSIGPVAINLVSQSGLCSEVQCSSDDGALMSAGSVGLRTFRRQLSEDRVRGREPRSQRDDQTRVYVLLHRSHYVAYGT